MTSLDDGRWMTTALAISGIIGVGIYMLPRSLAPLGQSAPYAWLISTVGIVALAFAASRLITPEGGGMQSYVGSHLGGRAGFLVTWSTWVSYCVSCAAIAVAVVSFLSMLVPGLAEPGVMPAAAIAILAMLTAINASGVRKVGGLAIVTVAVRVLPLFAIAALALLLPAGSRIAAATTAAPVSARELERRNLAHFLCADGLRGGSDTRGENPRTAANDPRAIFFATVFTAALYFVATQSLCRHSHARGD